MIFLLFMQVGWTRSKLRVFEFSFLFIVQIAAGWQLLDISTIIWILITDLIYLNEITFVYSVIKLNLLE